MIWYLNGFLGEKKSKKKCIGKGAAKTKKQVIQKGLADMCMLQVLLDYQKVIAARSSKRSPEVLLKGLQKVVLVLF